jgi:type III secretion system chaperone SycN
MSRDSRLGEVFEELGRRLGLGPLEFRPPGPLRLELEGLGTVSFETTDDGEELLAYLSWPLPPYDRRALLKAFEACDLEKARHFTWQAGLRRDRLLMMTRLWTSELDSPTLEKLTLRLIRTRETLK